MGKRSRKNSRRSRRTRKSYRKSMKGGGWGFTGASSIPGVPGTVNNPQVFTGIGDCRATEPGYWIPQSSYGTYQKGLPGMSGGKRRKTMKGGRYTFDLSSQSVAGVAPNAAAWWAGSYPPVQRIACEGSTPNPLNPGPHTPSTQPTPVASSNLHLNPQSGGANTVGVGNVDSMYYYGPTAGYDNKPSTWVDSVGAPVQLQIPFAARQMNPSCVTTGHPPPLTGALQKGGGFLNTIKNSFKKVTNTVGLTKQNTGTNAAVGAVYNTVGNVTPNYNVVNANTGLNAAVGDVYNAVGNLRPNNNLVNKTNGPPIYAAAVLGGNNYPTLPMSPTNTNTNTSTTPLPPMPPMPGSGGRRRRASKKNRKGRKGRKH